MTTIIRSNDEMTNRGRPREFSNAAEKQKAYRQRQKADQQRVELAVTILEYLECQKVTLRNTTDYLTAKGKQWEFCSAGTKEHPFGKLLAGGYHHTTIDESLWFYLMTSAALVEVGKRPFGEVVYKWSQD